MVLYVSIEMKILTSDSNHMSSQTLTATLTSKGQLTLPISIRRRLKLQAQDRVAFVVDESGRIELQKPKYTTIDSITGIVPPLPHPMDIHTMRQIAFEDRMNQPLEDSDTSGR